VIIPKVNILLVLFFIVGVTVTVLFPAMVGTVVGRKEFGAAFIAKVRRARGALNVKAALDAFHTCLAGWTALAVVQYVLEGRPIVLTELAVRDDPGIFGLGGCLDLFGCVRVAATKFQHWSRVAESFVIRNSVLLLFCCTISRVNYGTAVVVIDPSQAQFAPLLFAALAIDKMGR